MVSIRNIKKFFEDHPEHAALKEATLLAAEEVSRESGGIISGGWFPTSPMASLEAEFMAEVTSNPAHIRMGLEDMQAAAAT